MSAPKWIKFDAVMVPEDRKTKIWNVATKDGVLIGRIQWYAAWRKYGFYPRGGTLYEPTCLRDIASFIDEQMAARKAALAARPGRVG